MILAQLNHFYYLKPPSETIKIALTYNNKYWMTASLSPYSLVNRNGMRFYLRNFPAFAGRHPLGY
ncbi:MAG: hypothetical protein ACYCSW_09055 [bacterium]